MAHHKVLSVSLYLSVCVCVCVISDANDGVNKTIKQKGIFEVKGNVVDGALCAAEQCDANIYIIRERDNNDGRPDKIHTRSKH